MIAQRWVVLLAAVVAFAGTARLGLWQMDRAAQKNALQKQLDTRRALPPVPQPELAVDAATAVGQHQRRVNLTGRWVPAATVYLDNRQMGGRPGFFVVTPLLLVDGTAVAVQRGWQPRDANDRSKVRVPPTPPGDVTVAGRIAPPPGRLFEFDAAASGAIRQNLVLADYGLEWRLSLRPLSVQEDDGASALNDGLLRQWPAPAAGVDKHYGYAFQWFALAALILVLYVWFQLIRPRRSARSSRSFRST